MEKLNLEAYEKIDETFLKVNTQEDMSNFLYFHSIRNLRLSTLKIIDQFKLAKAKKLNPKDFCKVEFKNAPAHLFAQAFKKYYGLPVNEKDLTFMFEGQEAILKNPCF